MYVLESHPDLSADDEIGVHFIGGKEEVKKLNDYLVTAGLGAIAAGDISDPMERLIVAEAASPRFSYYKGFPNRLLNFAGMLLGEDSGGFFDDRRLALVDAAAKGHMSEADLRVELEKVDDFDRCQSPQWLTWQGYHATYSQGGINADFYTIDKVGLSSKAVNAAKDMGVEDVVYAAYIEGNTSHEDARPRLLHDNKLLLGNCTNEIFVPKASLVLEDDAMPKLLPR